MTRVFAPPLTLVVLLTVTGGPLHGPAAAAAEEYKPLLVVSLSSYGRLIQDVNAFVDPRLTALAVELLRQAAGIPVEPGTLVPSGLDTRRPWGLVVETDGQTFPVYGFVPAADLSRLLSASVATGRIKPPAGGVYEVKFGGQTWYLAQKGTWAFFATSRAGLKSTPADPVKVLRGLNTSHDVAARAWPQHLPADARQVANRWLTEGHVLVLDRKPGETSLEAALRNALANQGLRLAASMADEGETLTAGLSLDFRARELVLDLETTARPGTTTAESLAAPHKSETDFSGFLVPNAALTGTWTGEIARMPLHRLLGLVDSLAEQLLPRGGDRAAGELWRTIRESLLTESVDGGVAAMVRPNGVTLTIGGYVADGDALQQKLQALADTARSHRPDPGAPVWKPDAGRYQDVGLHTLSIPIPKDAKDRRSLVRMFGDGLDVVVGVGKHSLYVAAGKNPLETVKHLMRASQSKTPRKQPPVQFTVALAPLARFLAETADDADRSSMAHWATLLEQSAGRDHVTLTARPVPRGTHVRLEVEDGVLRAATSLGARRP
jgi:hypothetical protein